MTTWFERAVDPEAVVRELVQTHAAVTPVGSAGPAHTLDAGGARMIRLRAAEPEGHWTATYLVPLCGPGSQETVSVHGTLIPPEAGDPQFSVSTVPFGADGWQCWLPRCRVLLRTWSADEALPALAIITDRQAGREVLQRLLRASSPQRRELTLSSVTAAVASYKPGVRVTVICDLGYERMPPPASWPPVVVAKAHGGEEAAAVFDAQRALWTSPLRVSAVVAIAEPIGYDPDLGLTVQGHLAHERTLKEVLADDVHNGRQTEGTRWIAATARGLAAVHTSGVVHGPRRTFDDELDSQRTKHDKLVAAVPWLADLTDGVAGRLQSADGASVADPLASSHGSFRTAQVVLMEKRVGIIDFDKLCLAEPASDIGPFLAKLRHTAVNKTEASRRPGVGALEQVDAIRADFLAAYGAAAPVSLDRVALWEALEHFSLVLGSAKKGLAERASSCAVMMLRHLDLHGI